MATLYRGTTRTGEEYTGDLSVPASTRDLDVEGVDLFFSLKQNKDGFPIWINLNRHEAMVLLAQLSTRMIGMAVGAPGGPPK